MRREIRKLKLESVLNRALLRFFIEKKGSEVFKGVAVSSIKLRSDLEQAEVYLIPSSLNKGSSDINNLLNEVNKSAWLIRRSILHYVDLRFIPQLIFKPDLTFNHYVSASLDKTK
ncbi:ribosome-binding factor A [Wolbachia endosymbiont of Pentidionis agamae]|uniref:ribosome-binding factor A n=1 Tax=Wolbachia endosymbiont of Pentidionis agamae TaxID=3110435 RepID=UPI002FD0E530